MASQRRGSLNGVGVRSQGNGITDALDGAKSQKPIRPDDVSAPTIPGRSSEEVLRRTQIPRYDEIGDEFFEELYLALNPDVAAAVQAGDLKSGLMHWLHIGHSESALTDGVRATIEYQDPLGQVGYYRCLGTNPELGFDPFSYLYVNQDVLRGTDASEYSALQHWIQYGHKEGRVAPGVVAPMLRQVRLQRTQAKPLGFNIFGPFGTVSGLGTAARALTKAVRATKLPFELFPFDMRSGELRPAKALTQPRYRINLLLANADAVIRVFASYPSGFFDDAYNIAVWQWELHSPRPDFYYAFAGLDEIWTNSRFQHEAFASIAPVAVTNIPLPVVASSHPVEPDRDSLGIPQGKTVFLVPFDVGSTSARKNPLAVVEAFRKLELEFDSIHLVIKYHSPFFDKELNDSLMSAVAGSINVTILSAELDLRRMDILRASCDCLVSAHRSEGFGLNIAEFLSLGKAVIATDYSGNVDFFDETVGFPVEFSLTEVGTYVGPYQTGYIWAEPSVASLIEQMRTVIESPAQVASRGRAAADRIRATLNLDVIGKRILSRIAELQFEQPVPAYIQSIGSADVVNRYKIATSSTGSMAALKKMSVRPSFSFVVPVYDVPGVYLAKCIESVVRQTYPLWELCLCDDASTNSDTRATLDAFRGVSPQIKMIANSRNQGIAGATNRALEMATGDFVVFLDNDDLVLPEALERVAMAIDRCPDADVLYSDENKIDASGQEIDHFFKPDWSPEHLESVMYVMHLLVVRKTLLLKLGGLREAYSGAQDYDLMLRCSRATNRIVHIPEMLYSWRAIPGSAAAVVDAKPEALRSGFRALVDHTAHKYGSMARVEDGLIPGTFRIRRSLPIAPKVTLLILTGNARLELPGRGEVCLVENFVSSILEKTDYRNYQIEIIDNSTLSAEQGRKFKKLGVAVKNHVTHAAFNYAAKANFAMRGAQTEHIVLLNDDMEVIRPDWLTALIELSTDPGIGAVGARLLHGDGSVQHAGTVLGVNGSAAHIYHSHPGEMVGYNGVTHLIRNYSAVTAACLATRRSVVAQLGWMDEDFAIDFNDVDLCLKMREVGYRIAYTPYAELFHFEGVSAKRDVQNPVEVSLFKNRWAKVLDNDPFYNPNLSTTSLAFERRSIEIHQ